MNESEPRPLGSECDSRSIPRPLGSGGFAVSGDQAPVAHAPGSDSEYHPGERGVALVMALILMAVLSVMAVSLTFISRSETWSSMNYRLMVQSRDAAEAGVNKAAYFLLYSYTPPSNSGSDLLSNYTLTSSPVQWNGNAVVLATSNSGASSNYPVGSVVTAYGLIAAGPLQAPTQYVRYATSATLLSMRQVMPYGNLCPNGTPGPCTIQSWLITSNGSVTGVQNSTVQVTARLERPITPTFNYAAFATSCDDGALNFNGGGNTDSYDSTITNSWNNPDESGGNVGTNGSLTAVGNPTQIWGSLSTPRTGVSGGGGCGDGAQATLVGGAEIEDGIVELPQQITYTPPAVPSPLPPMTAQSSSGSCWSPPAGCSVIPPPAARRIRLAPGPYGNISVSANTEVHLQAGTYRINSFNLTGNSSVVIDSGPVILNVAGCATNDGTNCTSYIGTPIDWTGGNITNWPPISTNLQIMYAGTGTIRLAGGSQVSAVLYAPNAAVELQSSGGNWFGAVIGRTVSVSGGMAITYDRALQNTAFTIGNYMLSSFNWKKF